MAHFIKLNVLDPGYGVEDNTINRKYNMTLINLDMVVTIEPSTIHSLIFMKGNQQPVRVKESLDDILELSKGSERNKNRLNG